MKLQTVAVGKDLVSPLAFIRLLIRMDELVSCQINSLCKAFITLTALIRLLTRMNVLVSCQIAFM